MESSANRRHVFISHHHADDAEVTNLTRLLARSGHDVRNSSIRAKPANQRRLEQGLVKDDVIRRLLRMKISWAGTIVVLIGKDTHERKWVNWEIEEANKQGKRIVGVFVRGGRMPIFRQPLKNTDRLLSHGIPTQLWTLLTTPGIPSNSLTAPKDPRLTFA